jgi:hypothetical protein
VGNRIDLAKKFMEAQRDNKPDDAIAMLADDVTSSNPMTGTQSGKAAVEAGMRNQPPAPFEIQWGEPQENGDEVKVVGEGSPFGPIQIVLGFNGSDQINKIDIGLAT